MRRPYYNENLEDARKTILDMIKQQKADLFIAGPAFNAGRYGVACGDICKAVSQELDIPVITGMYIENPGVDLYRRDVNIVKTGGSAADMRNAVPVMAKAALKLARGEELKAPEDGVLEKGVRKNMFRDERGSKRAVEMLIAKLNGQPFETEYPMPDFDRVTPTRRLRI